MSEQLRSIDQATPAECQHTSPCPDCPWARTALRGWLGGLSVEDWLATVRSDEIIECHVHKGAQCVGATTFRKHIAKLPRDPDALVLPADRVRVFATPAEFAEHHGKRGTQ